jgi:cell division protein FtsI (penicillin-binding protein 3)
VRPRLLRGVVDPDGTVVDSDAPTRKRVVSPFVAAQVRSMLVGVVEDGTGTRAQIPGYLVAGKTGTARVPKKDGRGYSHDLITTFVGMAPADDPRLVVLVQLYNPTPRVAATTAGPVFREIMQYALAHQGVQQTAPLPGSTPLIMLRAHALPTASPSPTVTPSPSDSPKKKKRTP